MCPPEDMFLAALFILTKEQKHSICLSTEWIDKFNIFTQLFIKLLNNKKEPSIDT